MEPASLKYSDAVRDFVDKYSGVQGYERSLKSLAVALGNSPPTDIRNYHVLGELPRMEKPPRVVGKGSTGSNEHQVLQS